MNKKVVMYLPHRGDPHKGELISADLLPLELVQLVAPARERGWTVELIDAMIEDRPLERVLEACADADIFCSSCILGYQVFDGVETAHAVREKYPNLTIWWGGWFPSAVPELFLGGGAADAVCVGQGELTFGDMLDAHEAGEPLDGIPGLALLRDDHIVRTGMRKVVGFDAYPRAAFDSMDLKRYYAEQLRQTQIESSPNGRGIRHRFPDPPGRSAYPAISYHSSFGCPEPCAFCNSPGITNRAWKSMPALDLLDHIQEIHERDPFVGLRFQDANFGVNEKRTAQFSRGLLERNLDVVWHATIEIKQVNQYKAETLDLMAESGLYVTTVGAETATWEQQQLIGKRIKPGETLEAVRRLDKRGIIGGISYIIGFPDESEESMLATLQEARAVKLNFDHASVDVFPYRPIPGAAMWQHALDQGYEPPTTAAEYGAMFEYKVDTWKGGISDRVNHDWTVFNFLAPWVDGHVKCSPVMRKMLGASARWRMRSGSFGFPVEFKIYHHARRLLDKVWTANIAPR